MMRLGLILHLFRRATRIGQKRMIMTVAALTWGTISIVLLLSFGEGLKVNLQRNQRGMGEGIVVVWPGETEKSFQGLPKGRQIHLEPEDVAYALANVPEIEKASGEMRQWGVQLAYGKKSVNTRAFGVEPVYEEMRANYPEAGGRFINATDMRERRRVLFMGNELKEDLFGKDEDAVGKVVLLNRVPFTVIGVLKKKMQMGMYGGPDAERVTMPITTFKALFGKRYLNNLVYKPASSEFRTAAQKKFFEVMGRKYRFDKEDSRAFYLWDTIKSQAVMTNILLGIEIFLGIIGAITLIIAGVGVANIMYAVVKRRSVEIGIQMALGARKSYIMGPLILETLALAALGGVFGIGIGAAIVQLLGWLQGMAKSEAMQFMGKPTFSATLAFVTVGILGVIGFLAGYFPARRAVSIQPAQVLRYE
jgi:putative ABC transport system permease protein